MSTQGTARVAVLPSLVLAIAACAAERLEARDPAQGATAPASATTPIVRPTALQAEERQLRPAAVEPAPPDQPAVYVCPMHPEVQSTTPGDCPKCGMKLVRKERSP